MRIIDWNEAEFQIKHLVTLTDEQTDEGLRVLEYARELYDHLDEEIPQNILLLDRNGCVIYKIITRKGNPTTVFVKLPFTRRYKYQLFGIGIAATICAAVIYIKK